MSLVYQLADGVVCRQTNSDLRMLFDRKKGVMYELNETASAVIANLSDAGGATVDQITAALSEEFESTADEMFEDVRHLLYEFTEAGLIVERSAADVDAPREPSHAADQA